MSDGVERSTAEAVVPLAVHAATRRLLQVVSAAEARETAVGLVRGLGGTVVSADDDSGDVVAVDLSFGDGQPLFASAGPATATRSLIDRHLAPFLLDARRVLDLDVRTARLAESSSTDALTGLPNRRSIDRALGRLAGGDSVVIVDLDHLGRLNDECGLSVGDDVLRAFGHVLGETRQERDLVGRWEGGEFVAVVGASGTGANAFLQRLKRAWEVGRPRPSTFSAGIARSVGDPDETIRLADEALHRAKDSGRDRWCWATATDRSAEYRPTDLVKPYLADAVLGRREPAIRMAIDLLDNRVPSAAVVDHLLAAAQREVGERWQRNELTTADEHLASGVAAAALDALSAEAVPWSSGVLTVVTCAEGDWHSLAAQMFGESLRSHGVAVSMLGASTPVDAVAELLAGSGAHSLTISCSMASFFPGAARMADAAHARGVPVLMGGRALDADPRRAMALGADAWALSAREAAEILIGWRANPPRVDSSPTRLSPPAVRLFALAETLGVEALEGLVGLYPPAAGYDADQRDSTRRDLVRVVQHLAAATLVGDSSIFTEFVTWLDEVLAHRGVAPQTLAAGLDALHPLIAGLEPSAAPLLDSGRSRLVSSR